MKLIILFFLFVFSFDSNLFAQDYYRMSIDFTTKTKRDKGKFNLTKGRIFYDKYNKELIYDIHFPTKEKWIIQNSIIYKLINDSVYFTEEIPSINEFTVFHLALSSNLTYFGLNKAKFSINNIDKKGDLIISYWNIPPHIQNMIKTIAIARKENSLYSVVVSGENNKILNKQFFKNYINIDGFEFPGIIIQIYYDVNNNKHYQVMEFKNIVLNDTKNEDNYHYQLEK